MKRFIPLLLVAIAGSSSCALSQPAPESTPPVEPSSAVSTPGTAPVESVPPVPQGVVMTSTDGRSQLTVPTDWSSRTDLNDVAILQAANLAKEQYVIVIDDNKADFTNATLNDHSQITSQLIVDGLTSPQITQPVPVTINGYAALQREIHGSFDNINVVYLHTSIETPTRFYQVLTWTLKSKYAENRSIFEQVTQSFQEIS